MDRNTVLIVVDAACSDATLRAFIASVPDNGVHASFLLIGAAAPLPIWAYGSAPYGPVVFPEEWQETYQALAQEVADRANEMEQLLLRSNLEGDVRSVFSEPSRLNETVAAQASLSDFVFFDPSLSDQSHVYDGPLLSALFHSPVGVVLNSPRVSPVLEARHPFIGWNTSEPAIRAVHRALPILKQAKEVTIAVFDPETKLGADEADPGADVATWLSRHGCRVTVQQYPSGGKEIGHCILAKTFETGADLIVMGAYSHSRARQRFMGGTTRTVIQQKKHPVLLAH